MAAASQDRRTRAGWQGGSSFALHHQQRSSTTVQNTSTTVQNRRARGSPMHILQAENDAQSAPGAHFSGRKGDRGPGIELGLAWVAAAATVALEVAQVPAWDEANKPRAQEALRRMHRGLGQERCIAGEDFTVADVIALKPARVDRPQRLDHLARWHQEVSARPSA